MRMESGKTTKYLKLGSWLLVAWVSLWLMPVTAEDEAASRQYENVKTRQRQAVGQACAAQLEKMQNVDHEGSISSLKLLWVLYYLHFPRFCSRVSLQIIF